MIKVIGIRFKQAGKIYYFDPDDRPFAVGDAVIVETVRGIEMGEVAIGLRSVSEEEVTAPLKKVVRLATPEDRRQVADNRQCEEKAFAVAQRNITALNLDMKLVEVECTFDKSKLVFFFTAAERVDFRQLVKNLAAELQTRIELRQVGVRDEAKMIGGVGVCGRCLCCATWIGEFSPVSIRHAKEQELSMNPGKISGLCGRLKCCLRYEAEAYQDARERQPKIGDAVAGPQGEARVIATNILRENATIQLPDGTKMPIDWVDLKDGYEVAAAPEPLLPEIPVAPVDPPKEKPSERSSAQGGGTAAAKTRGKSKSANKRRRARRRRPKRSKTPGAD